VDAIGEIAKLVAFAWSREWIEVFGADDITLDECELTYLLKGRPETEIERVWDWLEAKAIPIHQGVVYLHQHVVRGWDTSLREQMEGLAAYIHDRLTDYFPQHRTFPQHKTYQPPGARS